MVNTLGASVLALAEHRIVRTFTGQFGPITGGVLSADGSWGATIGEDRALRIWHTADGREFARLDFKAQPKRLALSPDASPALLAVSDDAAGVWLIDARDARVKWSITLDNGAPSSLSFTSDGQTLLLTTARGVQKLDLLAGARLSELPLPDAGPAALSEDGSVLAVVAAGGYAIAVLNPGDGSVLGTIAPRGTVTDLALTRDASQLLVGSSSGLFVYDTKSGALLRTLDFNPVNDLALLADGESVLVAARETSLYRLSDGTRVDTFGQTGFVWGGSFAGDGRLEFPGVAGPTQVWDAARGVRLSLVERSTASGNQGAVLFSPSGLLLVNFERTATFWDTASASVARSFEYETSEARAGFNLMTFSKDGALLIGEGSPPTAGQIRFWDATNGKLLRVLPGHAVALRVLALSPAGDLLASAGPEQAKADSTPSSGSDTIKLWNLTRDQLIGTWKGHSGVITSLAFSPDGTRLLSSDQNGLVRLWSVPDGAVVRDLASDWTMLPSFVRTFGNSATLSPDGALVASAGVDWSGTQGHSGAIALWSALDGTLRARLLSLNEANLGTIQWSPDGKLLAAGTGTGMRIWCLDELPSTPPGPHGPAP